MRNSISIIIAIMMTTLSFAYPLTSIAEGQSFEGCLCAIDQATRNILIVPWIKSEKRWVPSKGRNFTYADSTVVEGESEATMKEIQAGKPVKWARLTGMTASGSLTGHFYDIDNLESLVGSRFKVLFSQPNDSREISKIILRYLFGGESMPAMVGMSSAQIISSGECPCDSQ